MDEKILTKSNSDFVYLQKKILKERGFALDHYNPDYIQRRIAIRIRARNVNSYAEYARILDRDPQEYKHLFDALTINVTQFFRDPSVFEAVKNEFLPTLLKEKKLAGDSTLRIWSAGCASGEEPYTIAILLKELFGEGIKNYLISIYATDIDQECILKAREGIYGKESLANLKNEYLNKYFTPLSQEKYKISDEIKNMTTFKHHHLLSDASFPALDIIFCRNVLIYFTQEMKDQILEIFYKSLNPHGFLIIGKSELLFFSKARHYFYLVNSAEHIFRKERRKLGVSEHTGEERRKKWWWGVEYRGKKTFKNKVLIVDDSAFMRLTLKNMLIRNGAEVIGEAENGVEAVEKYKQLKPDFVLMDILMPVEDGLEAIKQIVKYNSEAKIIVISAIGQETIVQEALQTGAKDYLLKPVSEDKLLTALKNIIEVKKSM